MPELPRARIKNGRGRRILRYSFYSRPSIPGNSKRSLRPSQHSEGFAFMAPEKYVCFLARAKCWCALDSRMQISNLAAEHTHADNAREQALVR